MKQNSMRLLSLTACILLCISSVYANTEWDDMVSPINHSVWPDIAIADLNTDGIPDIIAANPDSSEQYSDFSGLPIWLGTIYNGPNNTYYWGLAGGGAVNGLSASLPNAGSTPGYGCHVAIPLIGNTCNVMAEWTTSVTPAYIENVSTIEGGATYGAIEVQGYNWPGWAHPFRTTWEFVQDPDNVDNFYVSCSAWGDQGVLIIGQDYYSPNGAIAIHVNRTAAGSGEREKFTITFAPPLFGVCGVHRSAPDGTCLWNPDQEFSADIGNWFYDEYNRMAVRIDPPAASSNFTGEQHSFHTPLGPQTNLGYQTVEAADINQDGQIDIIAAGENGVDIYLQQGPKISPIGWVENPSQRDRICDGNKYLSVTLGDENGNLNPASFWDEIWAVQRGSGDGWSVYGELAGSAGPDYEDEPVTTYCNELTIWDISVPCLEDKLSGDKFAFSVKRINWGNRSGPSSPNSYTDLAVGDMDRNGWLDLLLAKESGGFDVFEYDGANWTYASTIPYSGVISDMVLRDFNRDGWLDVVASSENGVHYWERLTSGGWTSDIGPVSGRTFVGVTAADFNKDGYNDIAATESLEGTTGAIEVWYRNEDGSWFQNAKASVPVADPDNTGSGFMGIVKVSNSQTITESWTVVCEEALPDSGRFKITGSRSGAQSTYAVVGNIYTSDNGQVSFSLFDGTVDYAVGDYFTFNTGRGPLEMRKFGDLSSCDLDNDGNIDILAASLENFGVGVWLGNSYYGWTADTPPESSNSWQKIAAETDLNFDGNPDIVVGSYADAGETGSGIKVWTGRHSSESTWTGWIYNLINTGRFNKIDNGDLNLDGALDIAMACDDPTSEGIWVFTGNNLGAFEKLTTQVTSKTNYFSVLCADFNNDGRSDIAAGHKTQGFDVYLTEPDLTWSLSTSSVSTGEIYDLAAADVDHDGDLDIAVAQNHINEQYPGVIIYLNNGQGYFQDTASSKIPLTSALYNHWSVEFNDTDVNGVVDVIATNTTGNPGTQIFFGGINNEGRWEQIGGIAYSDASGLDHNYGLISNDFNLDNRPDFVVGEDGHGCKGYVGYGSRSEYCDFGNNGLGYGKIRDMDSMDLNNDGYPDVVIASEQNGVEAYLTVPGFPGISDFGFSGISAPAGDGDYVGITVADFTSDGLPDVIATRNQDSGVSGVDMWISQRDFSMAQISSTYPGDNGEFNVGADTTIYVQFNKEMDAATMTYNNVQLTKDGSPVAYSFITSGDKRYLEITPNQIEREAEYEVLIVGGHDGVRDISGNQFDGNYDGQAQASPVDDYSFSFTTVDRIAPSIPIGVEVTPGDAQVTMRWLHNNDPILDQDLAGYYAMWKLSDGEDWYWKYYTKEEVGTPPQVTFRGLTNGVEVECFLDAVDNTGNESPISEMVAATPFSVKPQIWWGGLYNSMITSASGGDFTVLAYVFDMQGDAESVELYFDDMPTGAMLVDGGHPDFPAGLGLYALNAPLGPLNTGFAEIPFQLVAHDAAGNDSFMWPYFHVMADIPSGSASSTPPEPGSWKSYFLNKEQAFIKQTELPYEKDQRQPSTSPNRPQILCAGYAAHPYADFEWGARHWMTAIIVDPDNTGTGHDLVSVEMYLNGEVIGTFGASGIADEGFLGEIELGPVVWGCDMRWYGQENDPDGADGENHWPEGPLFLEIQAFDRQGNASDVWPNFTVN